MNLYTVVDKEKHVVGWAGSLVDARRVKKEVGGKDYQAIEVPTTKAELLEFLNKYAVNPR
jgi:hypothetical protein